MFTISINNQPIIMDIGIVNNNVVLSVRINGIWHNILGMNSMGEVWRYPGLPPNSGFRLNKEGKILECK